MIRAAASLLAGLAAPAAAGGQAQARPADTASAGPPATAPTAARVEWRLRVALDSGEVRVAVTSRAATVEVVSPAGTFVQAFDTADPLSTWADDATVLPAPEVLAPDTVAPPGAPARVRYSSARLADRADSARRSDLTEYRLTRFGPDSAPAYLLTGANGAWPFTLTVAPDQAVGLLAALRGEPAPGALPFEPLRIGPRRAEDGPDADGAWGYEQLDRHVAPGPRGPALFYPSALRAAGARGTVRLSFIIDADGTVRRSSVRLIGKAHPLFAAAARDAVLGARYTPAKRGGGPVAERTIQSFAFETR